MLGAMFWLQVGDAIAQLNVRYITVNETGVNEFRQEFKDEATLLRYLDKLSDTERENGYLSFSVDSIIPSTSFHEVHIHKGRMYRMDKASTRLVHTLGMEMKRLEDAGYPFAQIIVDTSLDSGLILSRSSLYSGPYIEVDSVLFLEKPLLPQRVLNKHIGIKKGMAYSESVVKSIDRKLKSLPFVKVVRPTAVVFAKDYARVILAVEKRNANRVDGIFGFQPDEDGRAQFTGDIKLELQNALSHLDKIGLNWQRVADNSQKLDLEFRYPYLFGTSIGVDASLAQFRQDTTFNEVELDAGVFSILEKGGALKMFFASKTVNDLLTNQDIERQGTSIIQYGLAYQVDLTNDPLSPRNGIQSLIQFSYGDKNLIASLGTSTEERKVGQWTAKADLKKYFPLQGRSVLLLRANAFHIESETLILNELERVGGVSTLRGHDEQSIRASTYIIGTAEYRLLTGDRSYLNAFLDYGFVESAAGSSVTSERAYGFGVGTAVDTKAGLLSLSYALGTRDGQPIILSTGKVHIGYSAVF